MKAYLAWDVNSCDNCSTVVFAENASKARQQAFHSETCEDASYTDIRVKRFPEMDGHYRGVGEIDWYNPEDRKALAALGWSCFEPAEWECSSCPAKELCRETEK